MLDILRRVFDENLQIESNIFSIFDYVSCDTLISCSSVSENEGMIKINTSKLEISGRIDKGKVQKIYFVFKINDELFYWVYNNNDIVCKIEGKNGGMCIRSYISICRLKKINF